MDDTEMGNTMVLEEKPIPVRLCSQQIPHGTTWDRTLASMVTDQQLTACAITWLRSIGKVAVILLCQLSAIREKVQTFFKGFSLSRPL